MADEAQRNVPSVTRLKLDVSKVRLIDPRFPMFFMVWSSTDPSHYTIATAPKAQRARFLVDAAESSTSPQPLRVDVVRESDDSLSFDVSVAAMLARNGTRAPHVVRSRDVGPEIRKAWSSVHTDATATLALSPAGTAMSARIAAARKFPRAARIPVDTLKQILDATGDAQVVLDPFFFHEHAHHVMVSVFQDVDFTFDGDKRLERFREVWRLNGTTPLPPRELLAQMHLDTIAIPIQLLMAGLVRPVNTTLPVKDARLVVAGRESPEKYAMGTLGVSLAPVRQISMPRNCPLSTAVGLYLEALGKQVSDDADLYAKTCLERTRDVMIDAGVAYVNEYIRLLPGHFDAFRTVDGKWTQTMRPNYRSGPTAALWLPGGNDEIAMHAPLWDSYIVDAKRRLAARMPSMIYWMRRQNVVTEVNERYLLRVIEAAATARGLSNFQCNVSSNDPAACAATLEVLVTAIAWTACTSKYASDVRSVGPNRAPVAIDSYDCHDALDTDDCEGLLRKVLLVEQMMLRGRSDVPVSANTELAADPVWQKVRLPRQRVGTWESPILRRAQRILGHYCFASILGSVLAGFPGMENQARGPLIAPEQVSLDNPDVRKFFRIARDGVDAARAGGHQFGALVPITVLAERLGAALRTELVPDARRDPKDQVEVDATLRWIEQVRSVATEAEAVWPACALGGLLVEGTAFTSPFLVVPPTLKAYAPRVLQARRASHAVSAARLGRDNILGTLDMHPMGLGPNGPAGEWAARRGTRFYRNVLHIALPGLLDMVPQARDLASQLTPIWRQRWGVPLETFLATWAATPAEVSAATVGAATGSDAVWLPIPFLHRMSRPIRDEMWRRAAPLMQTLMPVVIGRDYTDEAQRERMRSIGRSTATDRGWSALLRPHLPAAMIDAPSFRALLIDHFAVRTRINVDNDNDAYGRVLDSQTHFVPIHTCARSDLERLIHFIETQRRVIVNAFYTRTVPIFGTTHLVVVTVAE